MYDICKDDETKYIGLYVMKLKKIRILFKKKSTSFYLVLPFTESLQFISILILCKTPSSNFDCKPHSDAKLVCIKKSKTSKK